MNWKQQSAWMACAVLCCLIVAYPMARLGDGLCALAGMLARWTGAACW